MSLNFFLLTKYALVQKGQVTFRNLATLEIYCASDLSVTCSHPKSFTLGKAIVEEALRVGWMRW